MELKEGMYVRTKDGVIGKIMGFNAFDENKVAIITGKRNGILLTPIIDKNTIIKSSYNIINLIELGDIVKVFMGYDLGEEITNIFEVVGIAEDDDEIVVFKKDLELDFVPVEKIKSIVTKDQFESMASKIY